MEITDRCRIVNRLREHPKLPKPEENKYDSFFYIFREPPKVPDPEESSYGSLLYIIGMLVALLSGIMLAFHYYKKNSSCLRCISTARKHAAHQLSLCASKVSCIFSMLFSDIKVCVASSFPVQRKATLGRSPTCTQTITLPCSSQACQASPSGVSLTCQIQTPRVTFSDKPTGSLSGLVSACAPISDSCCISQGSVSNPCERIQKTDFHLFPQSKPFAFCNTPCSNSAARPSRSCTFKTTLTSPPKCCSLYTGNTSHGSSSFECNTYIKESKRRDPYPCHSSPCVKSIGTSPCPYSKRGLGDYDRVKGTKNDYDCGRYRTISTCMTPVLQSQHVDQCESPCVNSTFRNILKSVAGRDSPVTILCKKYLGLTSLIPYKKTLCESVSQSVYSNNMSNSYSQQRMYDVKQNLSLISSLSSPLQDKRDRCETSFHHKNKSPYTPYIPTTVTTPWKSHGGYQDYTQSSNSFSTLHNMHEPDLGSYCSASLQMVRNSSIISSKMFDKSPNNIGYNTSNKIPVVGTCNSICKNTTQGRCAHECSMHNMCSSVEAQTKYSPLMCYSSTTPRELHCAQTKPTGFHESVQQQTSPFCIIPVSTQQPPSKREEESQIRRPKVFPRSKAANGRPIIPKPNYGTNFSPKEYVSPKATREVMAENGPYPQCPKTSPHTERTKDDHSPSVPQGISGSSGHTRNRRPNYGTTHSRNEHVSPKATNTREVMAANGPYPQCPMTSPHTKGIKAHHSPTVNQRSPVSAGHTRKRRIVASCGLSDRQKVVRFSVNQKH